MYAARRLSGASRIKWATTSHASGRPSLGSVESSFAQPELATNLRRVGSHQAVPAIRPCRSVPKLELSAGDGSYRSLD